MDIQDMGIRSFYFESSVLFFKSQKFNFLFLFRKERFLESSELEKPLENLQFYITVRELLLSR